MTSICSLAQSPLFAPVPPAFWNPGSAPRPGACTYPIASIKELPRLRCVRRVGVPEAMTQPEFSPFFSAALQAATAELTAQSSVSKSSETYNRANQT